jgi:predicted 3-demethylubiquinone-9 3-methyltransferase (glyoxalase superfamily)
MASVQKITPCLWFDGQAEDAARFYVSIFKNAKLGKVSRFPNEGQDVHHQPEGQVMVAEFTIEGQNFVALNGGPQFKFSEAVSFQVSCDTQAEIDYYWSHLTADGGQEGPCGWLKDRFGLSWQIVPSMIGSMMTDPDPAKPARVMKAFMQMKKLDLAALERAFAG